jgi:inorganic pyrophosphatase
VPGQAEDASREGWGRPPSGEPTIIAVLDNDHVWGKTRDIRDLPGVLVERLQHYFLTYKLVPGQRATARIT